MANRFVACDIGASNTRYLSNNGNISVLPNNMEFIKADTRIDLEPNSNEIESALDVTIECDNGCTFFPVRVLVGQLANRHSATNVRPTILQNKSAQQINYVSAVIATALSSYKYGQAEEIDLYLALPPIEVKASKDLVRNNLIGSYVVTFHKLNNTRIKFKIRDVHIYEESFLAIFSYFFNMDGSVRETAEQYARGSILSLDIGASTTDLAIVKDMQFLEKSGQTYKTGGNVARDFLANYIRGSSGYDVTDEVAEEAIAEGRIQYGNEYLDCSEAVSQAKAELAKQIVVQMQSYFRMVGIPMQTIRAIVVSGGGSMEGFYTDDNGETHHTSNPISDYITNELSRICSGIAVERFTENPRMANIMGLFIRANIDAHRRKQAELQAQTQSGQYMQQDSTVQNTVDNQSQVEQNIVTQQPFNGVVVQPINQQMQAQQMQAEMQAQQMQAMQGQMQSIGNPQIQSMQGQMQPIQGQMQPIQGMASNVNGQLMGN